MQVFLSFCLMISTHSYAKEMSNCYPILMEASIRMLNKPSSLDSIRAAINSHLLSSEFPKLQNMLCKPLYKVSA